MTDLVVVGGGPVGLGTAVTAAQAGLDVTVFDPRGAPVDKACGEGLMPSAVEALARIGVHPAECRSPESRTWPAGDEHRRASVRARVSESAAPSCRRRSRPAPTSWAYARWRGGSPTCG
jgi:2-polyprenyl-6-methoxyphenol hydroxylase-like FAD-dependent oxidoreductase